MVCHLRLDVLSWTNRTTDGQTDTPFYRIALQAVGKATEKVWNAVATSRDKLENLL